MDKLSILRFTVLFAFSHFNLVCAELTPGQRAASEHIAGFLNFHSNSPIGTLETLEKSGSYLANEPKAVQALVDVITWRSTQRESSFFVGADKHQARLMAGKALAAIHPGGGVIEPILEEFVSDVLHDPSAFSSFYFVKQSWFDRGYWESFQDSCEPAGFIALDVLKNSPTPESERIFDVVLEVLTNDGLTSVIEKKLLARELAVNILRNWRLSEPRLVKVTRLLARSESRKAAFQILVKFVNTAEFAAALKGTSVHSDPTLELLREVSAYSIQRGPGTRQVADLNLLFQRLKGRDAKLRTEAYARLVDAHEDPGFRAALLKTPPGFLAGFNSAARQGRRYYKSLRDLVADRGEEPQKESSCPQSFTEVYAAEAEAIAARRRQ